VARPQSGQKRAGKKEKGLGEGIFARPAEIFGEVPATPKAWQSIPFKIGSDLVV